MKLQSFLGCLFLFLCFTNVFSQFCGIIVPNFPLTAAGLATPYILTTIPGGATQCNMTLDGTRAFVEAAIINLDTGDISIYTPLVITKGTTPAIAPVVPVLPTNYVAGIWFGYNGETLVLLDAPIPNQNLPADTLDTGTAQKSSLMQGACVGGGGNKFSSFGQFAACNAQAFFFAANDLIGRGKLIVPPISTYLTGFALTTQVNCPTVRDFSVVDQDQSDNVVTKYIYLANGQLAQNTAANRATLTNQRKAFNIIKNPSDNGLLNNNILTALGNYTLVPKVIAATGNPAAAFVKACSITSKWERPDLADRGATLSALALDELQAAAFQDPPIARIPVGNPMVLDANGNVDIQKTNAYRRAVNQFAIGRAGQASTFNYCLHMYQAAPRIFLDSVFTKQAPSPNPDAANLFAFLAMRFNAGVGILGCPDLLGMPSPLEIFVAPATKEHLEKYSPEILAKYKTLTVVATDAVMSQSVIDQINALQPQDDAASFAIGESVVPAAATVPESLIIPLIVVSSVLGGVVLTGTTVAVVKKVKNRKRDSLAVDANVEGSKQLGYTTDITNGYPIPITPRPNSPSPKNRSGSIPK